MTISKKTSAAPYPAVGTFLAGLLGYSTKRYNQAAGFE